MKLLWDAALSQADGAALAEVILSKLGIELGFTGVLHTWRGGALTQCASREALWVQASPAPWRRAHSRWAALEAVAMELSPRAPAQPKMGTVKTQVFQAPRLIACDVSVADASGRPLSGLSQDHSIRGGQPHSSGVSRG